MSVSGEMTAGKHWGPLARLLSLRGGRRRGTPLWAHHSSRPRLLPVVVLPSSHRGGPLGPRRVFWSTQLAPAPEEPHSRPGFVVLALSSVAGAARRHAGLNTGCPHFLQRHMGEAHGKLALSWETQRISLHFNDFALVLHK